MLLGCTVKDAGEVAQATGLPVDYLELKGDMLCTDAASLRTLGGLLRATGLPVTAMTSPLPRRYGCRVVGEDADHVRALTVFREMCDRAAGYGVRTVVLGSGQARSYPAGYPPATARGQFRDFLAAAAAECQARGMTLALEPLAGIETNLVNSCAEARPLVDELAGAGVRITVDCYHVVTEGLPVAAEVAAAAGAIGHAHTSSIPRGTGEFRADTQREFVSSLVAADYGGGLTIEDQFNDFGRDAPVAVAALRQVLETTP